MFWLALTLAVVGWLILGIFLAVVIGRACALGARIEHRAMSQRERPVDVPQGQVRL